MQRSVVQLQCGLRRGLALTCTYAPALRLAFAFAIALVLEQNIFASCIAVCVFLAARQGENFGLVVAQSTENRLVLSSTKYGFFLAQNEPLLTRNMGFSWPAS